MVPQNFLLESEWEYVNEHIQEVFETGETIVEANFRTKEGKGIPFLYSGKLLIHEGKPCLVGMGIDISKRKIAEMELENSLEEKKTLLVEIQHRNKNNLAMIISILEMEIKRTENKSAKDILEKVMTRLQSLSELNNLLYSSESTDSIYLDEYMSRIVKSLSNAYIRGINTIIIEHDYDHIKIKPRDAARWGLITNELLTNAIKYAFPNSNKGTIKIMLKGNRNVEKFEVSDNGIDIQGDRYIDQPTGLGLLMVKMLAKQLGGTLTYNKNKWKSFSIICDS